MNDGSMGSMTGWMGIGMMLIFAILALLVIGLVVYWAMRLAMRHETLKTPHRERTSTSSSTNDEGETLP